MSLVPRAAYGRASGLERAGDNAGALLGPLMASLAGGHAVDRLNPRLVFGAGAAVYVLAYATFAWEQHAGPVLLAGFVLAGVGIGFAETAESTMVALSLPDRLRGNGYGVLGLVQSLGDLGASLVAGLLWALVSPTVAFGHAAAWMVAAVIVTTVVKSPAALTNRPETEDAGGSSTL